MILGKTIKKEIFINKFKKTGHFILGSGLHTDVFYDFESLEKHQDILYNICTDLLEKIPQEIDCFISVPNGGNLIAKIMSIIRGSNYLILPKIYNNLDLSKFKDCNICLVEDVVTTGKQINNLESYIKKFSPNNIIKCCIINRQKNDIISYLAVENILLKNCNCGKERPVKIVH